VRAAQPFRPYLIDLFEPQKYPELRSGTTGPTKRPYDIAGWTLSMQMGVTVDRIDDRFDASLAPVSEFRAEPSQTLDHRENASFLGVADLLARGAPVRWAADGAILTGTANSVKPAYEIRRPRVALYQPWLANADEGWTEWLLDRYRIPFTAVHNKDFDGSDMRAKYDTVILAQQSPLSILHGLTVGEIASRRAGESAAPVMQRADYAGGIGVRGLNQLEQFIQSGGTLVALDTATELPVQFFPLSIRNALRPPAPASGGGESEAPAANAATQFYCPGSLVRITVDTTNPLAFGMPKEAIAFSTGGEAFDIALAPDYNKGDREIRSVARFATRDLLASGWVSGERAVLGKHALLEAKYGKGRVILFAFRPQFRGQPYGTFKFLLNAIYLGSAQMLN
jgi:hypothetical protein